MYKFEEFFFSESVGILIDFSKMILIIFVISHWMACLIAATGKAEENKNSQNWINMEGIQDED